jgi:predicted Rossmann fold nucleotide-binding protein DprA/Smf involved in DNA uptake
MKFYAGIGSRETPPDILEWMTSLAANLETMNYVLRSGGAQGADVLQDCMDGRSAFP